MALINSNSQQLAVNTREEEINHIIKLFGEGDRILVKQTVPLEATIVLGNSGSGKSTFTLWSSDYDKLTSENDPLTFRGFEVTDPLKKIGSNPTASHTVFPDLMISNETKAAYYDFPGFENTRGVTMDIAIIYFIKKVMDIVGKVKMVFVVDYNSVTRQRTKDSFIKLVTHASQLVKNYNKYKNSTTLMVSKIPDLGSDVSDQDIIKSIVKYITAAREHFVGNPNALQFIDGVLQKNETHYPHICLSLMGINQTGLLKDMPHLEERKRKVQAALNKFDYVQISNNDFGYTLPKKSLYDARTLLEKLNERLFTSLTRFLEETRKYFYNEEVKLNDVVALYNQTTQAYNKLSEIRNMVKLSTEPRKCVREICDSLAFVNSPTARESLSIAENNYDIMSFLRNVSGISVPFKCADVLDNVVDYADKSRNWYKFLKDLYHELSTYKVQNNPATSICNGLATFVIEGEDEENKPSDVLEKYVKGCSPQYDFQTISNITVNKPKFTALRSLLNLTMKYPLHSECKSNNTLTITGQYVKFSDIRANLNTCKTPLKFVRIFALDKVFVDDDLELNGEVQLAIIAPTWNVLGDRKIILRGEPGKSHNPPKARNGQLSGNAGESGKPGLPGGAGGSFYGIGDKLYNFSHFTLKLIGGRGGQGQDGGNGATGEDGNDAYNDLKNECTWYGLSVYPKESAEHTIHSQEQYFMVADCYLCDKEKYILGGKDGKKGAVGGDGGKEGKGGNPGDYIFIKTSSNGIKLKTERVVGLDGEPGNAGAGGNGGKNGKDMYVEIRDVGICKFEVTEKLLNDRGSASNEKDGVIGANINGMEAPKKLEKFLNIPNIVNEYKAYLRANLFHSVREFDLWEFLGKVEGLTDTQNQPRKRRSADINFDQEMPRRHNIVSNAANAPIHALNSHLNTLTDHAPTYSAKNVISSTPRGQSFLLSSSQPKYKNSFANLGPAEGSRSVAFDGADANKLLAFTDFLIRCITKVKPFNTVENPVNFTEIKAFTLNIVEEFETVLAQVVAKLNLPEHQPLEFDPIVLISRLEKELINPNYKKISKILYQSIEKKDGLDYIHFENYMLPKINLVLAGQEKENLYNSCVVNENYPNSDIRLGIGARMNFNRIDYKVEENYNLE